MIGGKKADITKRKTREKYLFVFKREDIAKIAIVTIFLLLVIAPVNAVPTQVTLTLYVHEDSVTGQLLSNVRITGSDGAGATFDKTTDSSGKVVITGTPGTWQFTASKSGYDTKPWSQPITSTTEKHAFFSKLPGTQVTLTLYVHEDSTTGQLLSNVRVTGSDSAGATFDKTTDYSGKVVITGTPGTWQFTASKSGYDTKPWSQPITSTTEKHAFISKLPHTYTFQTTDNAMQITGDGSAYSSPWSVSWTDGQSKTVTVPSSQSISYGSNYVFTHWSGQSSSTSPSISISTGTATAGTYTANYKKQHVLIVAPNLDICSISGSGWYDQGTTVRLTAPTVAGYTFNKWQVDGTDTNSNPTINVVMNTYHGIIAVYSQTPQINHRPDTPTIHSGSSSGNTGISYTYSTSATDPDGDTVKYTFDWGDGSTSETGFVNSGTSASASHSWSSASTFNVKSICTDSHGASSEWSDIKTVTITIIDTTLPTIAIINPTDNQKFDSSTITVSGTASDFVGVSKIEIKVGSGSWQLASGTTSWSKTVILALGSNTITARVTDTSGNSKETSVTVIYMINDLGAKAASLAEDVVGAPYLHGGKGFDSNSGVFVDTAIIKSGYYYWSETSQSVAWGTGLDCSGLVFWAFNKASGATKYQSQDNPVYYEGASEQWADNLKFEQIGTSIPSINDLQPGYLLFLDTPDPKRPDHEGMYVGNGNVIHAKGSGTIEKKTLNDWLNLPYGKKTYRDYFMGYGRVKELAYTQPLFDAPWEGEAYVTQGNLGTPTHNYCEALGNGVGCTWENAYALDISKGSSFDILAPSDGQVIMITPDISTACGRGLAILHTADNGDKIASVYCHLKERYVNLISPEVIRGQVIGKTGSSAKSQEVYVNPKTNEKMGNHLHFSVVNYVADSPVNYYIYNTVPIEHLYLKDVSSNHQSGGSLEDNFKYYNARNHDLDDEKIAIPYHHWFLSNNHKKSNDAFDIIVRCPVDISITDPEGHTINKQTYEIPGATYTELGLGDDGTPDAKIKIPERKVGNYIITVTPKPGASPTSTFTLQLSSDGASPQTIASNVPVNQIPVEPYGIQVTSEGKLVIIHSPSNPVPEFPSTIIPVIGIIGLLGAVFYIQGTRKH